MLREHDYIYQLEIALAQELPTLDIKGRANHELTHCDGATTHLSVRRSSEFHDGYYVYTTEKCPDGKLESIAGFPASDAADIIYRLYLLWGTDED